MEMSCIPMLFAVKYACAEAEQKSEFAGFTYGRTLTHINIIIPGLPLRKYILCSSRHAKNTHTALYGYIKFVDTAMWMGIAKGEGLM
jgi:hypothetical protein